MSKILFILISLFFVIKIFSQKEYKKLIWLFASILFFPLTIVIIPSPYISFSRFLILGFIVTFILQTTNIKKLYNKFPLRLPLSLVFICLLLIGLYDSRLDTVLKFSRPIYYFIDNFSIILLTYHYINSISDIKKVYNFIILSFIFFSIYGIIIYIVKWNSYSSFIAETYNTIDFGNIYTKFGDTRFRIASFAWHPIYYGLLLAFAILMLIFIYYERRMQAYSKFFYTIVLGLLVVNLFLTNSRTPILSLIIGLCFFYLFAIKFGNKVKIATIGFLCVFCIVSVSPKALMLISDSLDTLNSKGSKIEGSSIKMREIQMGACLLVFVKKPIFGNGFDYISEDLGFSSDKKKRYSSSDFQGFESYIYKLLIEQGSIGIFANIFFFIYLFIYLFKMRNKVDLFGKKIIYLSVSMTITFLFFIIGIGDLNSFMIFMALLGVNLKAIQLSLKIKPITHTIYNLPQNY